VRTGSLPPALIFGGTRGTGKTTSARILAAALNCEKPEGGDACGQCAQCLAVQKTTSLSVLEVDAASNGGVDEVRKIKEMCAYAHEGEWRVVLLDEAHSMSKEAFNALLKVLEEPPPNTIFVLLTTEVSKILETVRSRSMYFEFRRMTIEDIVTRLRFIADTENITADDDLLVEIANRVQGGMRDAVMLLDQISRVGVSTADEFREMFGLRNVSVELLRAALGNDHAMGSKVIEDQFYRTGDAATMVNDLVLLVRDLLICRSGGDLHGLTQLEEDERRELATRVSTGQLVSVIKVLWDLKARTRAVDNDQRAAMEMAFVLITDTLNKVTQVAQTNVSIPTVTSPLSLDVMRRLARST